MDALVGGLPLISATNPRRLPGLQRVNAHGFNYICVPGEMGVYLLT
jgi:hypothetical protein